MASIALMVCQPETAAAIGISAVASVPSCSQETELIDCLASQMFLFLRVSRPWPSVQSALVPLALMGPFQRSSSQSSASAQTVWTVPVRPFFLAEAWAFSRIRWQRHVWVRAAGELSQPCSLVSLAGRWLIPQIFFQSFSTVCVCVCVWSAPSRPGAGSNVDSLISCAQEQRR